MDISEFYDADPARRQSDEEGFGDGWSTEADQHSTYRANWLYDTGELYIVREPHPAATGPAPRTSFKKRRSERFDFSKISEARTAGPGFYRLSATLRSPP